MKVHEQAWLTDVLERTVPGRSEAAALEGLPPWGWKAGRLAAAAHTRTP